MLKKKKHKNVYKQLKSTLQIKKDRNTIDKFAILHSFHLDANL